MSNAPNRWAVREAAEATFYDISGVTEKAIVTLKTLKMTEVQTTGETVYAMGGRGNAKLVGFSSNREATVTLQDAIFDNLAMAMLTGNSVTEGEKQIYVYHEGTTSVTGELTLPAAKQMDEVISAFILDTDGITNKTEIESVTVDEPTGLVVSTGLAAVTKVRIYGKQTTDAGTKTIKVTSDKFGGTYKLVVDVIVKDEQTGQEKFAQFIAPRVKIEDEFSFNFSPEGDPSVLDIPLEILKDPASTDMWELIIY